MGCAESSSSEQAGRKVVHSSKAPAFFLHMSPLSYVALEESHLPGVNWVTQKHWLSKLKCLSYCCSSVAQSCLTPCDPMDCSTPGLPVHHQLLEFTQTHVH